MLTVDLSCPCCSSTIRCHRLIAPGERLRCPHCGSGFRVGNSSESGETLVLPRNRGILLAWLLFALLLLLCGGSIVLLMVIDDRAHSNESESAAVARYGAPSTPVSVGIESSADAASATISDAPAAPAPPRSKPVPSPDSRSLPLVVPPRPPSLPEPPRRQSEPAPSSESKAVEPEKPRAADPDEETKPQWLPPSIQTQVDRSIDRGIEFLRRRQNADGSWGHQTGIAAKRFTAGITALSALTLLECGVPAKDVHVQSAAHYLRKRMPELRSSYSISLAILFFDRLSEESDAANIRTLALRLIAGQKSSGGWDYSCPTLSANEELGLLALLYKDRPTTSTDLFAMERKPEAAPLDTELYRPQPSKVPPLELFVGRDPLAVRPASRAQARPENAVSPELGRQPLDSQKRAAASQNSVRSPAELADDRTTGRPLLGDGRRLSQHALEAAEKLPKSLRRIPALRSAELLREPPDLQEPRTDNSNTQFAILGLLTAENYDVPMERAMALLDWRFRNSMTVQGGWNYQPTWQTTPSMTAAALMGLALKHGLLLPNRHGRGRNVAIHDDEILHRGFLTLTAMLENYYSSFVFNQLPLERLDLYCLWTVERVAVLYNLRELGNLEWYPTGVRLLMPLQQPDGSWSTKGTTCLEEPSVATSFALLFLKRSNLARGLTKRLSRPADKNREGP